MDSYELNSFEFVVFATWWKLGWCTILDTYLQKSEQQIWDRLLISIHVFLGASWVSGHSMSIA